VAGTSQINVWLFVVTCAVTWSTYRVMNTRDFRYETHYTDSVNSFQEPKCNIENNQIPKKL